METPKNLLIKSNFGCTSANLCLHMHKSRRLGLVEYMTIKSVKCSVACCNAYKRLELQVHLKMQPNVRLLLSDKSETRVGCEGLRSGLQIYKLQFYSPFFIPLHKD